MNCRTLVITLLMVLGGFGGQLAYGGPSTVSEVPIEKEFGFILGAELDVDFENQEFSQPEFLQKGKGYQFKFIDSESFNITVSATSDRKIYSITAIKEHKDCAAEFEKLRRDWQTRYKVTPPQIQAIRSQNKSLKGRFFDIKNPPTENSHRGISGTCDGRFIVIRVQDYAVIEKQRKKDSLAYEAFVQSLPVCSGVYLRPIVSGWLSSKFGNRSDPSTGRPDWHNGVDFAGRSGQPVYASDAGVIISISYDDRHGNRIEIKHGNGDLTSYSHLESLLVFRGEYVEQGQPIAILGSTGRSTGPHVGFELERLGKKIDPVPHMVVKDTCRPVYLEMR